MPRPGSRLGLSPADSEPESGCQCSQPRPGPGFKSLSGRLTRSRPAASPAAAAAKLDARLWHRDDRHGGRRGCGGHRDLDSMIMIPNLPVVRVFKSRCRARRPGPAEPGPGYRDSVTAASEELLSPRPGELELRPSSGSGNIRDNQPAAASEAAIRSSISHWARPRGRRPVTATVTVTELEQA